jgi:hypothetical protein
MSHRKLSGRLPSLIFDYDTMIRSMTTLVKADQFLYLCMLVISHRQPTFYITKTTPYPFKRATRRCHLYPFYSRMHKYEHQKSVSTVSMFSYHSTSQFRFRPHFLPVKSYHYCPRLFNTHPFQNHPLIIRRFSVQKLYDTNLVFLLSPFIRLSLSYFSSLVVMYVYVFLFCLAVVFEALFVGEMCT